MGRVFWMTHVVNLLAEPGVEGFEDRVLGEGSRQVDEVLHRGGLPGRGLAFWHTWGGMRSLMVGNNKAFRHVESLFIQGRILVQNKKICEWAGVYLFDYVNSKEVLNKNSTLDGKKLPYVEVLYGWIQFLELLNGE